MKRKQGNRIIGYITFTVTGKGIENFLQLCTQLYVPIWDVKIIDEDKILCKAYLKDTVKLEKVAGKLNIDMIINQQLGAFPYVMKIIKQKSIVYSIIISLVVLTFLSNVVWKVSYTGVSTNLEHNLQHELQKYGLYEGGFIFSLDSLDIIQDNVMNEIPELLYLGIEKNGTTYHVSVVEKLIEKEAKQLVAQDLIAAKSGMIEKIFVRQGVPLVKVNEHINKNDILVTGDYSSLMNDEIEVEHERLAADGEVYARVWYEINAETSLHKYQERVTGDKKDKYTLALGRIQLPMLFFKERVFPEEFIEIEHKPIYFLKWKTPLKLVHKKVFNKEVVETQQNIDQARESAIEFALIDLQLKTGGNSDIDTYYILHESVDNGKVKLKLYVSIIENIAKSKPYK